jgi:hypothetical protein
MLLLCKGAEFTIFLDKKFVVCYDYQGNSRGEGSMKGRGVRL